jgi:hypothetical protein
MAATHPEDRPPARQDGPADVDEPDEAVEESPAAGVLDPDRAEPPEPSEPG